MPLTIAIAHSKTAGEVPTAADLGDGVLAVNQADGKLFALDAAGAVQELGGGGASVHVNAVQPATPQTGDLWLDVTSPAAPALKAYTGGAWHEAVPHVATNAAVAPAAPVLGELFVDTSLAPPVLKVWAGAVDGWVRTTPALAADPPIVITSAAGTSTFSISLAGLTALP